MGGQAGCSSWYWLPMLVSGVVGIRGSLFARMLPVLRPGRCVVTGWSWLLPPSVGIVFLHRRVRGGIGGGVVLPGLVAVVLRRRRVRPLRTKMSIQAEIEAIKSKTHRGDHRLCLMEIRVVRRGLPTLLVV